jgi:hypothetical protein
MEVDKNNMSEKTLSRDDLFLLMKSYENSVQQNTILLNQQQKLIEQQSAMLSKQGEVCESVRSIVNKLATCGDNVDHVQDTIVNTINAFGEAINQETQRVTTSLTTAINEQTNQMISHRNSCKEEHTGVTTSGLKNHNKVTLGIYGVYALLGGIVITVITLAIKEYDKYEILHKIARHLGI